MATQCLTGRRNKETGWVKEEQYLYKMINQMQMKQTTTAPLHVCPWHGDCWQG